MCMRMVYLQAHTCQGQRMTSDVGPHLSPYLTKALLVYSCVCWVGWSVSFRTSSSLCLSVEMQGSETDIATTPGFTCILGI